MLGVYISILLAYIYIMGRAHSKNRETKMQDLMKHYKKSIEAEGRLSEQLQYSDWSESIRAYKAAETRAANRLGKAIREYLGDDHTLQAEISLRTELQNQL